MRTSIGKEKIRSESIEIFVRESGRFEATADSIYYSAETKAELVRQIQAATVRKISVKIVCIPDHNESAREIRRGRITGVHAGNDNWLVTWNDGGTAQLSYWEKPRVYPADNVTAITEILGAHKAVRQALDTLEKLQSKYSKAMHAAIAAAQTKGAHANSDGVQSTPTANPDRADDAESVKAPKAR